MCGIAGAFLSSGADAERLSAAVARINAAQRARGPDGEGLWRDPVGGAVLGHRRLAVIGLGPGGAQPMGSRSGRHAIVFNGEIYNHAQLRAELERSGIPARSLSDTEVVVELFERDGPAMLARLRGMFAFAIWDPAGRRAFLARDPYGIKPLYHAEVEGGVLVASQVRALQASGLVGDARDPRATAEFLLLGSVAEPRTWLAGVRALPAGSFAWVEGGRLGPAQRWHDVAEHWRHASPAPDIDRFALGARVRTAVAASVARHLVADVPVGVFLSAGIDSAVIAALMAEQGAREVHGITVRFEEFLGQAQDEAPHAAALAAHYGLRHTVRTVTRDEFEADLPHILAAVDQPSIDGINAWYASKAAVEQGLKVVTSGIGGDELFQGYSSFRDLPRASARWRALSRVPGVLPLARGFAELQSRRTAKPRWRLAPELMRSIGGAWWLRRGLFAPAELAGLVDAALAAEALVGFRADAWLVEMTGSLAADPVLALAQIESTTYLRNQLLRDADWASMDHGLELRTPLVDAALLGELGPVLGAFRGGAGKRLLAVAPGRPLPAQVVARTKTGFGIPIARWLDASASASDAGAGSRLWARRVLDAFEARR